MKRITLIIVAVAFLGGIIKSQNIDDALRYSQVFYSGTARFNSMGGAFTALGADLSSLSQNPAGLGMFRSSEFTISPQLNYIKSTANFNGITDDYLYRFNLNQGGFVNNFLSNPDGNGLVSMNFGYSFNMTNNLNQNTLISGINNSSSIADAWARYSEGNHYTELGGPEGIAYDAWIIDTLTGSGGKYYGTVFSNYGDNPPSVYGQSIRRTIQNEGYLGEHAISIGGNYINKIFFGATVGINTLKYNSYYQHVESTDADLPSQFKSMEYIDYFEDKGTGFTFKLGVIAKPIEMLRIGVAIHTPTYYKIDEYFYEDVSSKFTNGDSYHSKNDPMRFKYGFNSPFRFLTGVAVQVKKIAMLSADYEYIDYSAGHFYQTGDGYDYTDKNSDIKNSLKSASNIRLGGELRLKNLYLRSGYGYYGKPFKADSDNSNLDYRTLSCGLGFRERKVSVDLGFTNFKSQQRTFMYQLDSSFDPADYRLTTTKNLVTLTLGYKFGI